MYLIHPLSTQSLVFGQTFRGTWWGFLLRSIKCHNKQLACLKIQCSFGNEWTVFMFTVCKLTGPAISYSICILTKESIDGMLFDCEIKLNLNLLIHRDASTPVVVSAKRVTEISQTGCMWLHLSNGSHEWQSEIMCCQSVPSPREIMYHSIADPMHLTALNICIPIPHLNPNGLNQKSLKHMLKSLSLLSFSTNSDLPQLNKKTPFRQVGVMFRIINDLICPSLKRLVTQN